MKVTSFCANCTREYPPDELVPRPLGKDDATVRICRKCDEETPIARDSTRGYEVPDRTNTITQNISWIARDAAFETRKSRQTYAKEKTPSYLLVMVPVVDGDRMRDQAGARRTFAAEPWAGQAKYLGAVMIGQRSMHLFEHPPDPDPARQENRKEDQRTKE